MPILFGLAAIAAFLLWKEKQATAATNPTPMLAAAMTMAQLQPGAAQYLPPVMAPDWVRVTYANAMASGNPIQMAAAANQITASGDPSAPTLAHQLSMAYQQITNNPIPGVAGVGAFFGGAYAHPHMIAPQHLPAPGFGMPGMLAPQRRTLDPHTIRTLAGMARARKVRRTADLHRALTAAAARRHLQNT
jgi:hypothetical protein